MSQLIKRRGRVTFVTRHSVRVDNSKSRSDGGDVLGRQPGDGGESYVVVATTIASRSSTA
jgi:hypothetical protein